MQIALAPLGVETTKYFIVIACLDIFAVSHKAVNSHKNKVTGVASRVVPAIHTTPRLLVQLLVHQEVPRHGKSITIAQLDKIESTTKGLLQLVPAIPLQITP